MAEKNPVVTRSEEAKAPPTYYIGIGASAGGLEAIELFFKHAPANTGLAFVVIQHLSPDHKSLMVELLSKHTAMPVHRAEEGTQVQANAVYLIPPKKNLSIFHGKLLLMDQDPNRGINLPIDIFFRALAEDQGEKAVGIILSGTGSDGTRGIRSIKEAGGMVMVQDEESAKFDGMPKSAIATGLPDFILPPEEMPRHLMSFVKHPYASKAELSDSLLTDEDGLTRIFALLREHSKVDFTYYKPSTVTRRIERRMTVNQIHDLRDYVRYLERYPGEVTILYRELLINVTSFFRDKDAFDLLLEQYLPELFQREGQRQIRFWVAGCSTGEEAYSLAILARECMERMGRLVDIKIFATDVDRDAVLQAGNGIYPESITADINPQLLAKYFFRKDEAFAVARHIREMVVFAQHNLVKDPPFTNIDLVSCRNLLIYLQPVLQRKAMQLFSFSLNDNGILLLGTSETTGDQSDLYEPLHHKWKIYRSRGKRLGRHLSGEPVIAFDVSRQISRLHTGTRPVPAGRLFQEERVLDRLMQALSVDLLPVVMVVNEANELLHVLGDTEGLFKLPTGKMQNDVTKMATKDLVIPLATGIQKAFKTRKEVAYSNVRIEVRGARRLFKLRIRPLADKKGHEPLVMILLEESVSDSKPGVPSETVSFDLDRESKQRIQDLEQELQFTRENLQATVEELETSNEELQATNEELLASNEELQSTNEELQSVNEELYTVNAEYQSKILELTELNNDLDNLLTSTDLGTIFLDSGLVIRRFTHPVGDVFKIIQGDVGRPITHLSHHLQNLDPLRLIQRVQDTGQAVETEAITTNGRWYLLRVTPYHVTPNSLSGFVITLVHITPIKAAQQALQLSQERNALAMRAVRMTSWNWNVLTGQWDWGENLNALFGLPPGAFPATQESFLTCVHPEDRDLVSSAMAQTLKGEAGYEVEHRILWPDGNVRWVAMAGEVIRERGQAVRMVGVLWDITDQETHKKVVRRQRQQLEVVYSDLQLAQEALERKDRLLKGVLATMLTGIGMVRDARLEWINPAVCRMTGYSEEELTGMPVATLFPDEATCTEIMAQAYQQLQSGSTAPLYSQWRRKEGDTLKILLHFTLPHPDGLQTGLLFSALDLSQ